MELTDERRMCDSDANTNSTKHDATITINDRRGNLIVLSKSNLLKTMHIL